MHLIGTQKAAFSAFAVDAAFFVLGFFYLAKERSGKNGHEKMKMTYRGVCITSKK